MGLRTNGVASVRKTSSTFVNKTKCNAFEDKRVDLFILGRRLNWMIQSKKI